MVTAVTSQLNLNSTDATTRVGTRLNTRYQRVCAEVGVNIAQRVVGQASGAATVGSPVFTWTGVEKLERVFWLNGTDPKFLEEISFDDLRKEEESAFPSSDEPTKYAYQLLGPSSVTIRVNATAATTYTLKADGLDTTDTLSGSQVPQFTTNYHYILVAGAKSDELMKMEQPDLAAIEEGIYEKGLSKLKLFIATTAQRTGRSQQGAVCRRCGFCG